MEFSACALSPTAKLATRGHTANRVSTANTANNIKGGFTYFLSCVLYKKLNYADHKQRCEGLKLRRI